MYEIESKHGPNRKWSPADEELAATAMENVKGTGVSGTFTLPDDANVPVEAAVATSVREEYKRLNADQLQIRLDDGEVVGDGEDEERVVVELLDVNGNPADVSFPVELTVGGYSKTVPVVRGTGEYMVTTTKDAGSTIDVQAVGVDGVDGTTASTKKTVSVV